jgi:hypothetical protein
MIDIEQIEDHEDGSATVTLVMSHEELYAFAKIGLLDSLRSAAREQVMNDLVATSQEQGLYDLPHEYGNKDDIECRSLNPAKICKDCTCWKNQNE